MSNFVRKLYSMRPLSLIAASVALGGCAADDTDLRRYIDEVKTRPGGRIEPLPDIRPAPTFVYVPGARRSPFVPDTPQRQATAENPNAVPGPDPNRPQEFLEQYPLDSLEMVGTLNATGAYFGLIRTSNGLIRRVSTGDHMGQNYGRITSISDTEIRLIEIIPDGLGNYLERPAGVGLVD